ncbi:MAG: hypothetical protein M1838_003022 [Thelocarpon superellum]|nr:MAG: hypothetical protein M1838_003022 [Thelocarpon superellum]
MDVKWWEGLQKARQEASQQAGQGKKRGRPPVPAKGPTGQRGRPRKDPQAQAYRPELPELAGFQDPPTEDPADSGHLNPEMHFTLQSRYHGWMEEEEDDIEVGEVINQAVQEAEDEQQLIVMSVARGASVERPSGETGYLTEDSEISLGQAEL